MVWTAAGEAPSCVSVCARPFWHSSSSSSPSRALLAGSHSADARREPPSLPSRTDEPPGREEEEEAREHEAPVGMGGSACIVAVALLERSSPPAPPSVAPPPPPPAAAVPCVTRSSQSCAPGVAASRPSQGTPYPTPAPAVPIGKRQRSLCWRRVRPSILPSCRPGRASAASAALARRHVSGGRAPREGADLETARGATPLANVRAHRVYVFPLVPSRTRGRIGRRRERGAPPAARGRTRRLVSCQPRASPIAAAVGGAAAGRGHDDLRRLLVVQQLHADSAGVTEGAAAAHAHPRVAAAAAARRRPTPRSRSEKEDMKLLLPSRLTDDCEPWWPPAPPLAPPPWPLMRWWSRADAWHGRCAGATRGRSVARINGLAAARPQPALPARRARRLMLLLTFSGRLRLLVYRRRGERHAGCASRRACPRRARASARVHGRLVQPRTRGRVRAPPTQQRAGGGRHTKQVEIGKAAQTTPHMYD